MDAVSIFERFVQASTFRCIQQTFFQLCCALDIHPCDSTNIYKKIRLLNNGKLYSKAGKLWSFLDKKWNQAEYCSQGACNRLNVLIIGAGPCGLRAAIECALLGAHVVVVEQRDKFSRNNVLHLWNFVIQDLKSLGAKIFFPKFCTGSIEHISIRRLQCILLKVALVLGVQVYENLSFLNLIEPTTSANSANCFGWKGNFNPHNHILSGYEFDVLIGADGKRNTIPGFPRKIVRGKLALGITANFVNNRTPAEEKVQEISGVAYIFNQAFFNEMSSTTGIDLENIVYYKDDTHYFVMSAKKQSLLKKGVIRQDFEDISSLLSKDNVDQEMLCKYAAQAADFATNGKLPQLAFAKNANLEPDVAMFDFTALFSAVFSTRLLERRSKTLILAIVGDSLHEPFWPTGSGCARGFLSVFDTAWMLRSFGMGCAGPTEIIAERENVYKLLAQTTRENMCSPSSKYTINPRTRYKRIGDVLGTDEICEQIDTDSPRLRPTSKPLTFRLPADKSGIIDFSRSLRLWLLCYRILLPLKIKVTNFKVQSWGDGRALAALISVFRPDALDYASFSKDNFSGDELIEAAFTAMELHYEIKRPCAASVFDWSSLADEMRMFYLESVICMFFSDMNFVMSKILQASSAADYTSKSARAEAQRKRSTELRAEIVKPSSPKTSKSGCTSSQNSPISNSSAQMNPTKRRSINKLNPAVVNKIQQMVSGSWEKEQLKKYYDDKSRSSFSSKREEPKSGLSDLNAATNLKASAANTTTTLTTPTTTSTTSTTTTSTTSTTTTTTSKNARDNKISRIAPQLDIARQRQKCSICGLEAYLAEQMYLERMIIHKRCFKCAFCEQPLRLNNYALDREMARSLGVRLFCRQHAHLPASDKMSKLEKSKDNAACGPSIAIVPAVSRNKNSNCVENDLNEDFSASTSLALKTMQRMRSRQLDADHIHNKPTNAKNAGDIAGNLTMAEREQTSLVNYRQQKMIDALKLMKCDEPRASSTTNYDRLSSNTNEASLTDDTYNNFARRRSYSPPYATDDELESLSADDDDDNDDDENDDEAGVEEAWAEFLEMLECALSEKNHFASEANAFLSEQNIKRLMEKFNNTMRARGSIRRSLSRASFDSTKEFRTPAHDASLYFTPKSSFPSNGRARQSLRDNMRSTSTTLQDGRNPNEKLNADALNVGFNRAREARLMRSNPRRSTITIGGSELKDEKKNSSDAETVYSTTEFSEPTSGVLIRKNRRDRLRKKNFNAEIQDTGRISLNNNRPRSHSSANFSVLLSSFKAKLNEEAPPSKLLMTPENIRRAQRFAQTALRRREKEEQLNAQEIRRSLDEVENRLDEVRDVGRGLERQLRVDAEDEWLLENWVFYSEELRRLTAREAQLLKRVRLISTSEAYQRLRDELRSIQACASEEKSANTQQRFALDDQMEREKRLMEEMLHVIEENKAVKSELNDAIEGSASLRPLEIEEIRQILADKQYNFANFEPVFFVQ